MLCQRCEMRHQRLGRRSKRKGAAAFAAAKAYSGERDSKAKTAYGR